MFIMSGREQFVHSCDLERKWGPTWKKSGFLSHACGPKPCTDTLCGRVELVLESQTGPLDPLPGVLIIRPFP